MSIITGKDLYNDDGTLEKLRDNLRFISEEAKKLKADLQSANTAFSSGRQKVSELDAEIAKLSKEYQEAQITLKEYEDKLKKMAQAQIEAKASHDSYNQILREAQRISKLTIQLNTSAEGSYAKLSAQYALNTKALDKMSEEERKNTEAGRTLQQETLALRDKMKLLKEAQGNNTLSVGDYTNSILKAFDKQKQLTAQLVNTQREFKSLPANIRNTSQAQEYHNNVTSALKSQISELEKVTGMQVQTNEKSRFSFQNLWESAKNLLAVYISLSGISSFGSKLFSETKQLDSLNKAFEITIPNAQKLTETNEYLSKLSENFGIDILTLKESYLQYNAAVMTSNLSAEQQRDIFGSVTKAISVLGLSGDKAKYVFLAIQQMMSKGRVSSEELRRQLGESLPGAMKIMADALNVSIGELDRMLKNGDILSEVALPKFVKAMEKAYGIENIKRIDVLATAQGRFKTSFTELVSKIDASNAFKTFFNTLSGGLKFIGNHITAIFNLIKGIALLGIAYSSWKASLALTNALVLNNTGLTLSNIAAQNLFTLSMNAAKGALNSLKAAFAANPIGFIATTILTAVSAFEMFNNEVEKTDKLNTELNQTIKQRLESQKVEIETYLSVANDHNRSLKEREKAIKAINDISPEYLGNITLETINTNKGKEAIQEYITYLEKKIRLQVIEDNIQTLIRNREEALISGDDRKLTSYQKALNFIKSFSNFATIGINNEVTATKNASKATDEYNKSLEKLKNLKEEALKGLDAKDIIKNNSNSTNSNKNTESTKDKLDPFGAQELLISAMEDGYKKDMELLKLNLEKKKKEFERYGLDISILENKYNNDRAVLFLKYAKQSFEERQKTEKERIDQMADGFDKEAALLKYEYDNKVRTTNNKVDLDKWYFQQYDLLLEKDAKKRYDGEYKEFEDIQKLEKEKFETKKHSSEQVKVFELTQEKEKIEKILQLYVKYGGDYTDAQIAIMKSTLAEINNELNKLSKGSEKKSIWDYLGFTPSEDQKKIIQESFQQATQFIVDYFNKQKEISDNLVALRQKETDQALAKLEIERKAQADGYHNNVENAEKEYRLAEKRQKDAIALQRKAQKEQILINAALQASNMVTATAKIWNAFPTMPYIAIPLIALMWGSFIATQAKALALTKKNKKGTFQTVGNGSHWMGNDTYIGSNNGVDNYAESGEGFAVFNRGAMSKYGERIKAEVEMYNRGMHPMSAEVRAKTITKEIFVNRNDNGKEELYVLPADGKKYVFIDAKGIIKKSVTVK